MVIKEIIAKEGVGWSKKKKEKKKDYVTGTNQL